MTRFVNSLFAAVVLMAACAASCGAQAAAGAPGTSTKTPTIDQSLEMYSVGSPKISPDGKHVVYEQTRTNWEANAFETDLWIADVATSERHQLTTTGIRVIRRSGRRMGSGLRLCRTGRDRCRSRRQRRGNSG